MPLPLIENKTLITLDSENKMGFLQDDELKRGIGDDPFPNLQGDDLKTFETAYSDALKQFEAKDVGKQCKECLAKETQALPDLAELVKKMSKGNVFDGRKSTLAIEKKKKDFYRIKELFSDKKDQIAAMVVPLQTMQGEVGRVFSIIISLILTARFFRETSEQFSLCTKPFINSAKNPMLILAEVKNLPK